MSVNKSILKRVSEIKDRLAKTTQGPWKVGYEDGSGVGKYLEGCSILAKEPITGPEAGVVIDATVVHGGKEGAAVPMGVLKRADADFIAHAWADIHFLLRCIEGKNPTPRVVEKHSTVKPGQIWESLDRRSRGRKLTVIKIQDKYALCAVAGTEKKVKIRLDRFRATSSGYKLVSAA